MAGRHSVISIDDVEIAYVVLEPNGGSQAIPPGDTSRNICFTPGGQGGGVDNRDIASILTAQGYRVLLHDRVNTGRSQFHLGDPDADPTSAQSGECGEPRLHAYFVHQLCQRINFGPCFFWGISAGSRMSVNLASMFPESVKGLILMDITAFELAADVIPTCYYDQHVVSVERGRNDMRAVLRDPYGLYGELVACNPTNRERILQCDPALFKARLTKWSSTLRAHTGRPAVGCPEEIFENITCPSLCIYDMGQPTDGMHTPASSASLGAALGDNCRGVIDSTNPQLIYGGALGFIQEVAAAQSNP